MWYRVGSRDELPGATGLAHFLEHLMFKGTQRLKKGEIDRITYQQGGSNNAFTFNDYTAYEFNFPRSTWKTALGVEADRMRNCTFNKAEFEAERQVVMEERRTQQDDPSGRFGEQLNTLLWVAHPYRNPVVGWMEDLKRVSRDEVFAFYQRYYVPANATLVITGDVNPEEALSAAQAAFAAVPRLPNPGHREIPEPERIDGARHLRNVLRTQVPRLSIGFQTPKDGHPDFFPLWILEEVLSEGNLSRLHRRLVDRDQLAAEVSIYFAGYRDGGEFVIDANAKEGATPERIEPAVWDELGRLASEPVSAQELERAKNQFYASWVHGLETANQMANVLGEANTVTTWEHVGKVVPAMQAVTVADVQRVAARYLARDRATIGYLYPRPQGEPSPAPSGTGMFTSAGRGPLARTPQRPTSTPPAAEPAPFGALNPVEKTLPNGLHLILLENHDLPSVTFSARINSGSYRDPASRSGEANFVAEMLDQGTASHSYEDIQAALEQVGASFEASGAKETSSAQLVVLSRYAPTLIPLFAELVTASDFPKDRLEITRGTLLTALKEDEDDTNWVARRAFNELVYGSHPGAHPIAGAVADVQALSREDLAAFHTRYYRPENTTLAVVGDFQAADMLARLTEAFSSWRRGSSATEPYPAVTRQAEVRTRRIHLDKTQTQIALGHLGIRRSSPDYLALKVMDTILGEGVGGGFTARIPYQLRDIQGLAYTVGSSVTSSVGREPGVFIAAMGVAPEKEQAAIIGLLKEIARIRQAPVTPTELQEAEAYLAHSYVFDFQTHEQLAEYLLSVDYYGLGWDYRRKFVQDVRKITAADVLRVAKTYLDPQHYSLVVVGPDAPTPKKGGAK
jgi:zinc protease